MRNSVPTCSSDELLAYLKKGDFSRYLKSLKCLSPYDTNWFRLQVLGIRVLAYQKKATEALEACRKLSKGLVDPDQRLCLKLEYLFYSWLLEGRKQATLDALESLASEIEPEGDLGIMIRHVGLRIHATELMLGMKNPVEKSRILEAYQALISTYLKGSQVDEAFFCLMEQIECAVTVPYSNVSKALECLANYDQEPNFQNFLFRKATLKLTKFKLITEQKLQAGEELCDHGSFKEIATELDRNGCKHAAYSALVDYGKLLLNFGRPLGRKLVIKCIKFFQKAGDKESMVHTVPPLVSWLKLTGRSQAVSGYLDLTSRPFLGRANPNSGGTNAKRLRDKGLMVFQAIADAELACQSGIAEVGEQKLASLLNEIRPFANGYLVSRVEAQLILCKLNLGKSVSLHKMFHVAEELNQLGFGRESIEFLGKRVLIGLSNKHQPCVESELGSIQELAAQIFSQKQDIVSAQAYGFLFEAIALSHLFEMRVDKSLYALKEANLVYQKFELRPRIAFNHLYQSRVFDLQYSISGNLSDLNRGLKALRQVSDLFGLLGFERGLSRVRKDMQQLEKRVSSGTINLMPSFDHVQKTFSGLDLAVKEVNQVELDGSLLGVFSDLASKGQLIRFQTVFPQPFNKN